MIIKYEAIPIKKVAGKLDILTCFDLYLQGFSIKDGSDPMIRTAREISDENCKEVEGYWNKIENIANPPLPFPQFNNPVGILVSFPKDYFTSMTEVYAIYSKFFKDMKPALTHREIISFSDLLKKERIAGDEVDVDISYRGTNLIQRDFLNKLYGNTE